MPVNDNESENADMGRTHGCDSSVRRSAALRPRGHILSDTASMIERITVSVSQAPRGVRLVERCEGQLRGEICTQLDQSMVALVEMSTSPGRVVFAPETRITFAFRGKRFVMESISASVILLVAAEG